MGRTIYDFVVVFDDALIETVRDINRCQDKIVAVTQNGGCYTIFYESRGNEKDGDKDG